MKTTASTAVSVDEGAEKNAMLDSLVVRRATRALADTQPAGAVTVAARSGTQL
jgi:hypothetical protein